MTDKKPKGAPRKNDTRDTISLRIRRSVITKLEAIGETEGISGRSIASEIVESTINKTKSPLASFLLLSPEALSILQRKAAIADCPVETLVEAAICAFDVSHFEQLHREAEQTRERLAQSLATAKNSLTMLNREVVDTHLQAPIPSPVVAPTLPQLPQFQPVQPVVPVAPVAPVVPVDEDDFADDDPDFERKQFAKYARLAERGYNPFAAPTPAPAETKPMPTMNFRFGGN